MLSQRLETLLAYTIFTWFVLTMVFRENALETAYKKSIVSLWYTLPRLPPSQRIRNNPRYRLLFNMWFQRLQMLLTYLFLGWLMITVVSVVFLSLIVFCMARGWTG